MSFAMWRWFDFSGGSHRPIFGVSYWDARKHWLGRFTLAPLWELGHRLHRVKYWLFHRFHPKHRYHMINTGLEPGYYDVDTLMLHGCFALLCRYVELEQGGIDKLDEWTGHLREKPDPNEPEGLSAGQADRQAESSKLYRWWKEERPAKHAREDELVNMLYGSNGMIRMARKGIKDGLTQIGFESADEVRETAEKLRAELWALQEQNEKDDQDMLHRLIDIRRSLWT